MYQCFNRSIPSRKCSIKAPAKWRNYDYVKEVVNEWALISNCTLIFAFESTMLYILQMMLVMLPSQWTWNEVKSWFLRLSNNQIGSYWHLACKIRRKQPFSQTLCQIRGPPQYYYCCLLPCTTLWFSAFWTLFNPILNDYRCIANYLHIVCNLVSGGGVAQWIKNGKIVQ